MKEDTASDWIHLTAFLEYCASRHLQLSFRGLLKVHLRYGLSGCCSPMAYIFPQS